MTCKVCKKAKKDLEFYSSNKGTCKECIKTRATRNRNENIDRARAYDRKRGNRQTPEYLKEYREKNPNKYIAHNMVNNAVRDGKLFPEPCEVCFNTHDVHAHHDDYLKPLNVRWLCAGHHKQWHTDNGEAKNGTN